MNNRRGSTPIYKGCDDSLKREEPSMNPRRRSAPIYKGCTDSLKGVDPQ